MSLSRKHRVLITCAPITDRPGIDRATRVAVSRARKGDHAAAFARQQAFDSAIAELVRATHVGPEITEWFSNEALIPTGKATWKKIAFNPAVLAIVFALAVIAGIFAYRVHERMNDFIGANTARHLLATAASKRSLLLDPLQTDAGALSDLFYMKHRLEHYDVPPEFADLRTLGTRVFDDEEVHRVAQIWLVERRMQLFLFPGEIDPKDGATHDFSDWRFVEQEGWTGAVREKNGVCFMAAIRGQESDLAPYLSLTSATPSASPAR